MFYGRACYKINKEYAGESGTSYVEKHSSGNKWSPGPDPAHSGFH